MRTGFAGMIAAVVLQLATAALPAQDTTFTRTEVMIPMRDGVKLYTKIFVPKGTTQPLPFMFIRTPYGIDGFEAAGIARGYGFLAKDGYIFVSQDARGKFKSEGEFVMQRAPRQDRNDPKACLLYTSPSPRD